MRDQHQAAAAILRREHFRWPERRDVQRTAGTGQPQEAIERDRCECEEVARDIAPARRPRQHARQKVARCATRRSEEHTSELQSLMSTSYAVFCLKKKTNLHDTKPT